MKPKKILQPTVVIATKWYKLVNLPVIMSDNYRIDWQIIDDGDAVSGVLIDAQLNTYLVKEWRGAWQSEIISVVTGGIKTGLSTKQISQEFIRESREEVGLRPRSITFLGKFKHSANQKGYRYIFLGQDLTKDPLPRDRGEYLEIIKTPLNQAIKTYIYQDKGCLTVHSALALILAKQRLDS